MLLDASMHSRFWAESINTACYLQNRLPSTAVGRTPFEIWHGRKPNLNHLRLFECSGYVLVPSVKRKKLDVKAIKMTFVGYSSEHKAYRMLDTRTGEIKISRDVRFLEFVVGSKEEQSSENQQQLVNPTSSTDTESIEWNLQDFSKPTNVPEDAESGEDFYGWDNEEDEWPEVLFEGIGLRGLWESDDEENPVVTSATSASIRKNNSRCSTRPVSGRSVRSYAQHSRTEVLS